MTLCLWFDHGKAYEAADLRERVPSDSQVGGKGHASVPRTNPSAKAGRELTVEFTVLGQANSSA